MMGLEKGIRISFAWLQSFSRKKNLTKNKLLAYSIRLRFWQLVMFLFGGPVKFIAY